MAKSNTRPTKMSVRHSTLDRISDLPENVLENILLCLPIRDAVRTSSLSKKWRNKWEDAPQLIFDTTFAPTTQRTQINKLLMTIYEVLLLHSGPIHKFTLSFPGLRSCLEIDRLVLFLSRKGVREFKLCISIGSLHKLPSYLFSCLQLKHLSLRSCIFTPPPTFKGFSTLITLKLQEVQFPQNFKDFISNCCLLEELMLDSCTDLSRLEINCPKLKLLYYIGSYQTLCFKNMPHLAAVSIYEIEAKSEGMKIPDLVQVLHSLPALKYLSVDYYFLKTLVGLPTPLKHLKSIIIYFVSFTKLEEVTSVFHLLRSSPNLQDLQIEMYPEAGAYAIKPVELLEAEQLLKVEGQSKYSLNQLRKVKLQKFNGSRPEVEFVKFLLAKSPVLETISLQPHEGTSNDKQLAILMEIIRFRRASTNAEIICEKFVEEYDDDIVSM
ncbi:F-box/FBD/LRR-repeat protein At1g13570-like [Mercurialis annua]|uniref:F-box/FBD/LRR-repeat protein At1g13570-like n=1 Tax=Mercurialis annua TaxID=3986 RepID=UPI00215DE19C|nr:F-box/FBD/LRR-repeat protein At1g13570-like [Mercurialis annua]